MEPLVYSDTTCSIMWSDFEDFMEDMANDGVKNLLVHYE